MWPEFIIIYSPGFYQRQSDDEGRYVNSLMDIVPTLYHQDKLRKVIDSDMLLYIVEGEKDVNRLWSLGIAATTNPMGAGKWRNSYAEVLRGADLIIIPDNDKAGRDHASHVAKSCYGKAKRVRILELPKLGKDVSDWIDAGGDAEKLKILADACPNWTALANGNGVTLRCMKDIQTEEVEWLWHPYVALGKLTLLEGDPGIGKSWITLALATAVSLGHGLPEQAPGDPHNVIVASAEDGLGDTIRPRLNAMGADVARIYAVDGAVTLDDEGFTKLENYICQQKPKLLIIDPLVAYLGASVDIHRANEPRSIMARLAKLAENYHLAIIPVRHLTKGGQNKAIYRGLGSIDFTAACRSVLLAGCDAADGQKRAIVPIKSNLAQTGPSVGYELTNNSFYWTGESSLTAAQILAADSGACGSELDEAITFLRDELAAGPAPARDIYHDAKGTEISKRTLHRAKSKLRIISRRHGEPGKRGGGTWNWELPEGGNDLDYQVEKSGNVNINSLENVFLTSNVGNLNPNPYTSAGQDGLPDQPALPCHNCSCVDYWLREANQWGKAEWLCSRCHPQPKGSKQ